MSKNKSRFLPGGGGEGAAESSLLTRTAFGFSLWDGGGAAKLPGVCPFTIYSHEECQKFADFTELSFGCS
uniref:hypothetical protein n=1 Tax=Candidatus Electronema sp. TaxID=2698783 RepID=UPI00405738C6